MDTKRDEKCENCGFYIKHYVKTSRGYAETLGHCKNGKLYPSFLKNGFKPQINCKFWQPQQENGLKENLKSNLVNLANRLNAVCEALLDEETSHSEQNERKK